VTRELSYGSGSSGYRCGARAPTSNRVEPTGHTAAVFGGHLRTSENSVKAKFGLPHHLSPESLSCEGP